MGVSLDLIWLKNIFHVSINPLKIPHDLDQKNNNNNLHVVIYLKIIRNVFGNFKMVMTGRH